MNKLSFWGCLEASLQFVSAVILVIMLLAVFFEYLHHRGKRTLHISAPYTCKSLRSCCDILFGSVHHALRNMTRVFGVEQKALPGIFSLLPLEWSTEFLLIIYTLKEKKLVAKETCCFRKFQKS